MVCVYTGQIKHIQVRTHLEEGGLQLQEMEIAPCTKCQHADSQLNLTSAGPERPRAGSGVRMVLVLPAEPESSAQQCDPTAITEI